MELLCSVTGIRGGSAEVDDFLAVVMESIKMSSPLIRAKSGAAQVGG